MSVNVESTPYFRLLASISVLRGREEGGALFWEGRGWALEGVAGDWRPDLVNKSAENNPLDFKI